MLLDCLDDAFRAGFFQKKPDARAGAAHDATPLLTWDTVARLIDARPQPDMMIVRNGKLLSELPESIDAARALFESGCSIVMRRLERHDDALRALAASVGRCIEGEVSIQSYATPRAFHSFGWHYDCEDVFIVQTAGTKEYLLRENTVNPHPRIGEMPRDMGFERERSPVVACTLVAGDWLYVPSGWWHVAKAYDDALSISIGVLTERAGWSARKLPPCDARPQSSSSS